MTTWVGGLTDPEVDDELRLALVAWADRMVEAELRHQERDGWLTLCAIEVDHPTVEVWLHQTGETDEPRIVRSLRDLLESELTALTRHAKSCKEAVASGDRFKPGDLKNWAGLRELQDLLHEYAGYMDALMPDPALMLCGGLDIGRHTDRTALAVMDGAVVNEVHIVPSVTFREQADVLEPLLSRLDLVAVDGTGMGLGLLELLRARGLPVVDVIIGGGNGAPHIIRDGGGRSPVRAIRVGKVHLLGRLLGLVHAREITVAPWCCNRDQLKGELGMMAASFTKRGGLSIQARTGHDDLALALALATLARDLSSQLLARSSDDGPKAEGREARRRQRLEG